MPRRRFPTTVVASAPSIALAVSTGGSVLAADCRIDTTGGMSGSAATSPNSTTSPTRPFERQTPGRASRAGRRWRSPSSRRSDGIVACGVVSIDTGVQEKKLAVGRCPAATLAEARENARRSWSAASNHPRDDSREAARLAANVFSLLTDHLRDRPVITPAGIRRFGSRPVDEAKQPSPASFASDRLRGCFRNDPPPIRNRSSSASAPCPTDRRGGSSTASA